MITLSKIEKRLGIPTAEWQGRCYEIASAIVAAGLVKGVAVYGHWLGPIAPKSIFYSNRHAGFCQHGWIKTPRDGVLDPTRWVFEAINPYLFSGQLAKHPEYDEGGNQLRKATMRPAPPFRTCTRASGLKLEGPALLHVRFLLGDNDPVDVPRLFWLANLPVDLMYPHAKAIYRAIHGAEPSALPMDNRRAVLG